METLLKKKEILRDAEGRFEQHGAGLIKKTQKSKPPRQVDGKYQLGGVRPGAGRPKGSLNKVTANLKAMILESLDEIGGVQYLKTLAVENSSAYAGLLGKILPAVLAADAESSGGPAVMAFHRVVVMPDGQKWVDGVTPKQIAPPVATTLPNEPGFQADTTDIKDLDE